MRQEKEKQMEPETHRENEITQDQSKTQCAREHRTAENTIAVKPQLGSLTRSIPDWKDSSVTKSTD